MTAGLPSLELLNKKKNKQTNNSIKASTNQIYVHRACKLFFRGKTPQKTLRSVTARYSYNTLLLKNA